MRPAPEPQTPVEEQDIRRSGRTQEILRLSVMLPILTRRRTRKLSIG